MIAEVFRWVVICVYFEGYKVVICIDICIYCLFIFYCLFCVMTFSWWETSSVHLSPEDYQGILLEQIQKKWLDRWLSDVSRLQWLLTTLTCSVFFSWKLLRLPREIDRNTTREEKTISSSPSITDHQSDVQKIQLGIEWYEKFANLKLSWWTDMDEIVTDFWIYLCDLFRSTSESMYPSELVSNSREEPLVKTKKWWKVRYMIPKISGLFGN